MLITIFKSLPLLNILAYGQGVLKLSWRLFSVPGNIATIIFRSLTPMFAKYRESFLTGENKVPIDLILEVKKGESIITRKQPLGMLGTR